MDIQIGELRSQLDVTDSSELLHPRVLEQITAHVVERVREELERDARRRREGVNAPRVDARRY